jgi:hypothetical protein
MIKFWLPLLFALSLILFLTTELDMIDEPMNKDYEILLVKLTSGDLLISYVDQQDPDKIELYRPIEIRFLNNGMIVAHGLALWMPFSDSETFLVDRKHVVLLESPNITIQDGYAKSTYSMYTNRTSEYEHEDDFDEDNESEALSELKGKNREIFEAMMTLVSNNSIKLN